MRKGIGASQIVPDLTILLKHYEELQWLPVKPIKLCKIALYSLNYFSSMTNKKKGANQLSFTVNSLLGKTTATGIRELKQRGFWKTQVLTGNEAFSLLICFVDAIKFVPLNFFTLLQRQFARKLGKTTPEQCKKSTSA